MQRPCGRRANQRTECLMNESKAGGTRSPEDGHGVRWGQGPGCPGVLKTGKWSDPITALVIYLCVRPLSMR